MIDLKGRLTGVLRLHDILFNTEEALLRDVMIKDQLHGKCESNLRTLRNFFNEHKLFGVPVVDVEYMCDTGAFGPFVSAESSRLKAFEAAMEGGFENWHSRHMDRGVHYGMMHYGDYIAPWPGDNGGDPDRPHWRDDEWECSRALFIRFLRYGDRRAYHAAVAAYRHFMDVDVHYSRHLLDL